MKDELGDRIKSFYESRSRKQLLRRTPVIIRVDGRSFSTFCKRFEKPYDEVLHNMLNSVTIYLCNNIQGAKFAERHSDEISILLTDYDRLTTDAFFDYEVQKICSIVASMATSEFTRLLLINDCITINDKWPQFDARCFNIPESEVANYFLWRVKDSERNSINMNARDVCNHKELQGKNCGEIILAMKGKGLDWESLPQERKTGLFFSKEEMELEIPKGPMKGKLYIRNGWVKKASIVNHSLIKGLIADSLSKEELAASPILQEILKKEKGEAQCL